MNLRSVFLTLCSLFSVILLPTVCLAVELAALPPKIQEDVQTIKKWDADLLFIKEVSAQNQKAVSLAEIQKIDKEWMASAPDSLDDRQKALESNACATHLKELLTQLTDSAEAFVMDNQGALVCMTKKTSDYWQGDEPKWQESFLNGKGSVFVDKAVYDDSTKETLIHVSVPVMDGQKAIGAICVGIKRPKIQ